MTGGNLFKANYNTYGIYICICIKKERKTDRRKKESHEFDSSFAKHLMFCVSLDITLFSTKK